MFEHAPQLKVCENVSCEMCILHLIFAASLDALRLQVVLPVWSFLPTPLFLQKKELHKPTAIIQHT